MLSWQQWIPVAHRRINSSIKPLPRLKSHDFQHRKTQRVRTTFSEMRTCSDVYYRIVHDPSLDLTNEAIVGYLDRFRGVLETPLAKFDPLTTDVPWHRLLYFRAGSEFLWHKETRLDSIFDSTNAEAANTPEAIAHRQADLEQAFQNAEDDRQKREQTPGRYQPSNAQSFLSALRRAKVHRCSNISGDWVAYESLSARPGDHEYPALSVATINVLNDVHLSSEVQKFRTQRWEAIIDVISNEEVGFWVLTEVTRDFAELLLSNDRIRNRYCVSDGPVSKFMTLPRIQTATGQLVLIRSDISVHGVYFFEPGSNATGKRFVFVSAEASDETQIALAAVHLTAGISCIGGSSSIDAVEKRKKQMAFTLQCLDELSSDQGFVQVVAGDFNFYDADEQVAGELLRGYSEAAPDSLGATYDPAQNLLAAIHSQSLPRRTDRICARFHNDNSKSCNIDDHQLLLTEPISYPDDFSEGLHASDHFGIRSTISVSKADPARAWTTETAIAFLPDSKSQEEINDWMRREHDLSFPKWQPHVNVLFPFIAPEFVEKFTSVFADSLLLQGFSTLNSVPESVVFDTLDCFKHKRISSVYLTSITNHERLRAVHETALRTAELTTGASQPRRRKSKDWTPHLTVARKRSDGNVDEFVEEAHSRFASMSQEWTLPLHELTVLQKIDGNMQVIRSVPIRVLDSDTTASVQNTLKFVNALARRIYNASSVGVELVGSSALTHEHAKSRISDVDVVLTPPIRGALTPLQFVAAARQVLGDVGVVRYTRESEHPIVMIAGLEESHRVLPVDIMFSGSESAEHALADTRALVSKLKSFNNSALLTHTLLEIKAWADAKQLTGSAHTLFSGAAWSVMLLCFASTKCFMTLTGLLDCLLKFFEAAAELDFSTHAITMDGFIPRGSLPTHSDSACLVMMPESRDNPNHTVSFASLSSLRKEFKRARDILRKGKELSEWQKYATSKIIIDGDSNKDSTCVFIKVTHLNGNEICEVEGWLRGRLVQFLSKDLGSNVPTRPATHWTKTGDGRYVSLSLACVVNEGLAVLPRAEWATTVEAAGNTLRDRFLRWRERPLFARLVVQVRL